MSIIVKDNIAYSGNTRAAFLLPAGSQADGKKISVPAERNTSSLAYADWGANNDLPTKMAKDIEECGILSAGLDMKARIAVGKGLMPFFLLNIDKEGKEDLEPIFDSELNDWFELNNTFDYCINGMYDKFSYGWPATQLMLSRNRKRINRIKRTDVVTARLAKMNKTTGIIENLFLCADWSQTVSVDSEYVSTIPVLEEGNEYFDLVERTSGFEFALINRQLRNGRNYYPQPLWYSAKNWVDLAKSIPSLKNAMLKNEITVKYLVTISSGYWKRIHVKWDTYTPERRQEIMSRKLEEIDNYLAGIENTHKSIITSSYYDPVTKQEIPDIKIEAIDDKLKDGKLLNDSSAGNSEILFAIQVNPALVGAGAPGGPYANNAGGSNIREGYLAAMMGLEWERKDAAKPFNIIKRYNGWDKRLEIERQVVPVTQATGSGAAIARKAPIVFRYPSGLLTTLDTGKSTKGEVL